jgi:hypothetical protein
MCVDTLHKGDDDDDDDDDDDVYDDDDNNNNNSNSNSLPNPTCDKPIVSSKDSSPDCAI